MLLMSLGQPKYLVLLEPSVQTWGRDLLFFSYFGVEQLAERNCTSSLVSITSAGHFTTVKKKALACHPKDAH